MHPYITQAQTSALIADMHATAARHNLAREAAAGRRARASRKSRTSWHLTGRKHDTVELAWPDGVTSVVELPQPSAPADGPRRGLAGSRR